MTPATSAGRFGRRVPSTVPGTAALAFFFTTRLAASQATHPNNALRLLKMLRAAGYTVCRKSETPPLRQGGVSLFQASV